ncbi:MAG: SRPBCC family protein [Oryzihumus sp.]
MSSNSQVIDAPPEAVWDVLADGWLYPLWVVGATRMRAVDATWPEVGAQIHHSAGVWPLVLDDTTQVLEARPRQHLRLRARGWPLGEADVSIDLEASGAGTLVTLREESAKGPGRLVPQPAEDVLLGWRNRETLKRLTLLAEGRAAG